MSEFLRSGRYFFLVQVDPRGGDAWSPFRWAEIETTVGSDLFEGGIIESIGRISNKAKLREGGGIVTTDAVEIKLANKDNLVQTLVDTDIEGRDITIWLSMMPRNQGLNASMEVAAGPVPDEWEAVNDGAPNVVLQSFTYAWDGTASVRIYKGQDPAPWLENDPRLRWRQGESIVASIYAYSVSGGDTLGVYIHNETFYWNWTLEVWSISRSLGKKEFVISSAATWTRCEVFLDAAQISSGTFGDPHLLSIQYEVPDTGDEIFIDGFQLEKEGVEASTWHMALDGMAAADLFPVYKGEVRNHPWTDAGIALKTRNVLNRRHKRIPNVWLNSKTNSNWVIPPDNQGVPFPMTYGILGAPYAGQGVPTPGAHAAKGLLVNWRVTATQPTIHFDRPGMKLKQIDRVVVWNEDSRRYLLELKDDSALPTIFWEWDRFPDNANVVANGAGSWARAGRMAVSFYQLPLSINYTYSSPAGQLWLTPSNMIDQSLLTSGYTIGDGTSRSVVIWWSQETIDIQDMELIDTYLLINCAISSSGDFQLKAGYWRPLPAPTKSQILTILTANGSFDNVPYDHVPPSKEMQYPFNFDSITKQLSFWLSNNDQNILFIERSGSTLNARADVYEIGYRIDGTVDLIDAKVGAVLQGREFQDTWGGRKTAGNLITYGVDGLESILRDELGIATADINTASFDTVAADPTHLAGGGGAIAGQQLKFEESKTVVDKLCKEFGMLYFVDIEGKETVRHLEYTSSPIKTLTARDFKLGSIKCDYTPRDQVYNDFTVNFDRCRFDDTYLQNTFCNRLDENGVGTGWRDECAASYASLGNFEQAIEFNLDWISDVTTARKFLIWMMGWLLYRRQVVEGILVLEHVNLELGDIVALDLPGKYAVNSSTSFILESSSIQKSTVGGIVAKFLEVKNVTP
jgi:hypothetical protein